MSYYLPDIFGGERDPLCSMNVALSNAMFGWVLVGLQAFTHLCFILRYLCVAKSSSPAVLKEFVEKGVIWSGFSVLLLNSVGWAVWFAWSQVIWTDVGDHCFEGYNLYDFILWLFLLLCTVWSAIMVGIILLFCICCAPCMIKAVRDYMAQMND